MSGRGNAAASRVTLHVVTSLDGFIAKKDNSISWLEANGSVYEAGVSISEEEAAAFVKAIDCYLNYARRRNRRWLVDGGDTDGTPENSALKQ